MPQMSPLKWLFLFIMFSLLYLLMTSVMYFNSCLTDPKSNSLFQLKTKSLYWKW